MNPPSAEPESAVTHPPHALYRKGDAPHDRIAKRGTPPPWRDFADHKRRKKELGEGYQPTEKEVMLVNAALYLRRPLLITGKPGTGKSTLAYSIAHQLKLGQVLTWPITSRSTLQQGLYHYDAVGRLQDASMTAQANGSSPRPPSDIGRYIRLGPLGTALHTSTDEQPRVLLIDEIDKSDVDLPNDLLHLFEEGEFEIPELSRLPKGAEYDDISVGLHKKEGDATLHRGQVSCKGFPIIVLTSNDEREFPPAFKRRCLRLDIDPPTSDELFVIVKERLHPDEKHDTVIREIVKLFVQQRTQGEMATDQLLNAVYAVINEMSPSNLSELKDTMLRPLTN